MSITDELREFAREHQPYGSELYNAQVCDHLCAIADRIDAEHKHAIGYVDDRDPETMAELGWVRLPVDADGEVIHVGDVVVEDGCGVPYKVMSMKLFDDCWDVGECGMNPNLCRHYQPDSWERIIEDAYQLDVAFGEGTEEYARTSVVRELVERCRRLAGER